MDKKCIRNYVPIDPTLSMGYFLTGHGSMNGYLYDRKIAATEMCDYGKGREDWVHVLAECEMYDDIRDLDGWNLDLKSGVIGMIGLSLVV